MALRVSSDLWCWVWNWLGRIPHQTCVSRNTCRSLSVYKLFVTCLIARALRLQNQMRALGSNPATRSTAARASPAQPLVPAFCAPVASPAAVAPRATSATQRAGVWPAAQSRIVAAAAMSTETAPAVPVTELQTPENNPLLAVRACLWDAGRPDHSHDVMLLALRLC